MSEEKLSTEAQAEKEEQAAATKLPVAPSRISPIGVLAIVGSLASLISIPLAIYFYLQAKERPELTYVVNPAKALLVKAGQASRLTASYDNKVITSDITAAQVAIWNAGDMAVKRTNILQPVVIYTNNNIPILEATIRKTNRQVVGLELNTDEIQKGRLTVSWNILEKNDGGVIQLIYAGSPDVELNAEGVIENQQQIVKGVAPWPLNRKDQRPDYPNIGFLIGILLTTSPPMAWLFVFYMYKRGKRGGVSKKLMVNYSFLITATVTYSLILAAGIYIIYYWLPSEPPFGF